MLNQILILTSPSFDWDSGPTGGSSGGSSRGTSPRPVSSVPFGDERSASSRKERSTQPGGGVPGEPPSSPSSETGLWRPHGQVLKGFFFFLTINRFLTPVAKDTGNIYLSTITNSLYFITSRHEVARSTSDLTLTGASAKRDASPEEALMSRSSARSWEGKRGNIFLSKKWPQSHRSRRLFFLLPQPSHEGSRSGLGGH